MLSNLQRSLYTPSPSGSERRGIAQLLGTGPKGRDAVSTPEEAERLLPAGASPNTPGNCDSPSDVSLTKVCFRVNHPPCRPQVDDVTVEMYVGGSIKQLGNWDPLKAKRMKRGVDGNWEVFLYLPRSADILYQYILKDFDGEVVWEGQLERQQRVQDSDRYSMIMQVRDSISMEEGAATGQMCRTPRGTLKPWVAELHQPDATINVKTPWVAEYDSPQAQAARDSVLPLPAFDNTKAYMTRPSILNKYGRPSESGFEDCLDPNAQCARVRSSTSGYQDCRELGDNRQQLAMARIISLHLASPSPSPAPAPASRPPVEDQASPQAVKHQQPRPTRMRSFLADHISPNEIVGVKGQDVLMIDQHNQNLQLEVARCQQAIASIADNLNSLKSKVRSNSLGEGEELFMEAEEEAGGGAMEMDANPGGGGGGVERSVVDLIMENISKISGLFEERSQKESEEQRRLQLAKAQQETEELLAAQAMRERAEEQVQSLRLQVKEEQARGDALRMDAESTISQLKEDLNAERRKAEEEKLRAEEEKSKAEELSRAKAEERDRLERELSDAKQLAQEAAEEAAEEEARRAEEDARRASAKQESEGSLTTQLAEEMEKSRKRARRLRAGLRGVQAQMGGVRSGFAGLREEVVGMQRRFAPSLAVLARQLAEGVAGVAAGVQAELEGTQKKFREEVSERKRLHNLVQELKGNIRVFCRVRPMSATEAKAGKKTALAIPSNTEVALMDKGKLNPYSYDRVFSAESTQEEVFEETQGLVVSVLDGYNVCIFAYGQTGSGKTHTMEGKRDDPGVNARALGALFELAEERYCVARYEFKVSMMEIYNEAIKDLFELHDDKGQLKKLEVKQDVANGGTHVPELKMCAVESMDEVQELIRVGMRNRSTCATNMNEHSSRSHMVFSVQVTCHDLLKGGTAFGKMHLIDLAGSERLSRTNATGDRLQEAKNINKSLSALGNCISALVNKTKHTPFRDSKLTHLLQDSLGGDAKMLMFVCTSPTDADASETNCSLQFAARAAAVELGPAKRRGDGGAGAALKEAQRIKEQAEALKEESALTAAAQREDAERLEEELALLAEQAQVRADEAEQLRRKLLEREQALDAKDDALDALARDKAALAAELHKLRSAPAPARVEPAPVTVAVAAAAAPERGERGALAEAPPALGRRSLSEDVGSSYGHGHGLLTPRAEGKENEDDNVEEEFRHEEDNNAIDLLEQEGADGHGRRSTSPLDVEETAMIMGDGGVSASMKETKEEAKEAASLEERLERFRQKKEALKAASALTTPAVTSSASVESVASTTSAASSVRAAGLRQEGVLPRAALKSTPAARPSTASATAGIGRFSMRGPSPTAAPRPTTAPSSASAPASMRPKASTTSKAVRDLCRPLAGHVAAKVDEKGKDKNASRFGWR